MSVSEQALQLLKDGIRRLTSREGLRMLRDAARGLERRAGSVPMRRVLTELADTAAERLTQLKEPRT